jgi:hypothetical protein
MPIQNDVLENVLREHINELLKNMVLESKVEKYWDPRKAEEIVVTWYWNNEKCDWTFKDDVIRTKINKSLRPIIDKIMLENKDIINFFL